MLPLVIDTNVLIGYCQADQDLMMQCGFIIFKIYEGEIKLAVDFDGEILDEYKNTLKNLQNNHARALRKFIEKERYKKGDDKSIQSFPSIRMKKLKELIDMNFHDDDIKFVRIAPHTHHKRIFSTDTGSFLNENYATWLKDELGVQTSHPSNFKSFLANIESD